MKERTVAIVGDSACSMRPSYPEVQESGVDLAPIEIVFFENGKDVPYSEFKIEIAEFYEKMRNSPKLPTTSGSILGEAINIYRRLSERFNNIVSVHLTSGESTVYSSALNAAEFVKKEKPELNINVIDTKQVSLASWLPTYKAGLLANEGADINDISNNIVEMLPKIRIEVALQNIKNVIKGGRGRFLGRLVNTLLPIKPIFTLKEGKLSLIQIEATVNRAREKLYERIKGVINTTPLTNLALVHTNIPEIAGDFRDRLKKLYNKEIKIFDAGAALGVHAGEGGLAIIYQIG